MVSPCNGTLFSNKSKITTNSSNMKEYQNNSTAGKKPDQKKYIMNDYTYIKF